MESAKVQEEKIIKGRTYLLGCCFKGIFRCLGGSLFKKERTKKGSRPRAKDAAQTFASFEVPIGFSLRPGPYVLSLPLCDLQRSCAWDKT
jgi:hypothetical protein